MRLRLRTTCYGRSLDLRERTLSTNDDARNAADAGAARGHVVVADEQTQGRGSRGRHWLSPPGKDLYLSIVERLDQPTALLPPLTLAVGLGVAQAVERLVGPNHRGRLKWPNDVWIGERKCAGVLVETASTGPDHGPIIIGIGLNVNRRDFPPELARGATSLAMVRGDEVERALALATVLEQVERTVERFMSEGPAAVAALVNERLAWRGELVRCEGIEGTLIGVAPSGALRLCAKGIETQIVSGAPCRP